MMKKELTILLIILSITLVGCQKDEVFCTEEAKICSDGSYVSRDSTNNCEFTPCPKTNFTKKVVSYDVNEYKTVIFQCISGSTPYFDNTSCGCQAPKKYVGQSLDECSRIKFACEKEMVYFSDEYGCGCKFN
jgi:hypothetical protein